jgi:hypothetical protein
MIDPIDLPTSLPTVSIGILVEFARGKRQWDDLTARAAFTLAAFAFQYVAPKQPAADIPKAELSDETAATLLESILEEKQDQGAVTDNAGGPLVGVIASLVIEWVLKKVLEQLAK